MLDGIFQAGSSLAVLGWMSLVFVPRWRGVANAVTLTIVALLAVSYLALIGVWWSRAAGGFGSAADVALLFQSKGALVAGWLHYLAFDLFVGRYIVAGAAKAGMRHWSIVPALVLTFLFGPIGLLLFWAQRAFAQGQRLEVPVFLRRNFAREPSLMAATMLFLSFAVPTLMAFALDDRTLLGSNVWLKPLKFEISLALYFATLAWFMPLADAAFRSTKAGRYVVWGAILLGIFEVAYISFQAARGEASHFNIGTPLAQTFYALMGVGAVILTSTSPVLAWAIWKSGNAKSTYGFAVVAGLVLTFMLGGIEGMIMSQGTGHSIGAALANDVKVPVFGWSRSIGDLRVAHFFGIHAQQIIPAFGAVAGRFGRIGVMIFALLYALITAASFVQAEMALPLLPL